MTLSFVAENLMRNGRGLGEPAKNWEDHIFVSLEAPVTDEELAVMDLAMAAGAVATTFLNSLPEKHRETLAPHIAEGRLYIHVQVKEGGVIALALEADANPPLELKRYVMGAGGEPAKAH